ncbi:MAG: hypothetical protein GY796_17495 [Chloroflexi bacterium]|nr:hypothetical protein [Chloroflexota bacterium]
MATSISTFQATIEAVEQLTFEEQAQLVDIIYRRLVEQRREDLVRHVAEAREAYRTGNVKRGSIDEFMAELDA